MERCARVEIGPEGAVVRSWPTAPDETGQKGTTMLGSLEILFGGLILLGMYLLPTVVAFGNDRKNLGTIFWVNLLLGWTVLGWGVAMTLATVEEEKPKVMEMPKAEEHPEEEITVIAA
jgi:hypothetical protein